LETYYIDSNILFYAKIMDREYGEDCARILSLISKGELQAATSSLAVIELANALRKYGLSDQVADVVDAVFSLDFQIIQVDPTDVRNAMEIFDEFRISPYDCTHVAVMKKAATNTIVSADRDFEKVTWVRRIDPKTL